MINLKELRGLLYTLFVLIFALTSCVKDNVYKENGNHNKSSLKFTLHIPEEYVSTRAMTDADTYKVDFKTLFVHLYKENKFYKSCRVNQDKIKPTGDNNYTVELEIPEDDVTVDFLFFINQAGLETPIAGEAKNEFIERTALNLNGRWDSKRLIPMWGEIRNVLIDENVGTKYAKSKLEVTLFRALSRVDIFLDSEENNASMKNYSLEDIYLFNSNNKVLLAPLSQNYDDTNKRVTAASQPQNVGINTDEGKQYIHFNIKDGDRDLDAPGVTLIPEQVALDSYSKDVCLVLGINAKNKKSYYKVDFHKKAQDGQSYINIDVLRNYRYIFQIKEINGLGKETPEEAMKLPSSNINVIVVNWDENINNGYVSGTDYFGLSTFPVVFEQYQAGQIYEVSVNTNLSEKKLNELTKQLVWENRSNKFDAYFDKTKGKLIIKTLTDNKTLTTFEDKLTFETSGHKFVIDVKQYYKPLKYNIVCESLKVHGSYVVGKILSNDNNITLEVVSDSDLTGAPYKFYTDKIDNISFEAEGSFGQSIQNSIDGKYYATITIYGKGTPRSDQIKHLTVISNGEEANVCTATIKMNYTPKLILAVAGRNTSDGDYTGYVMDNATQRAPKSVGGDGRTYYDTASYLFRTSEYNFGLNHNSTVKIAKLEDLSRYPNEITKSGYVKILDNDNTISYILRGTSQYATPDIVVFGGGAKMSSKVATDYAEYVKRGGCLLFMCEEVETIKNFFKALYSDNNNIASNITIRPDANESTRYQLLTQLNDPIYNGPFGNLNGTYWAENFGKTDALLGIPETDVVIYSNSTPVGNDQHHVNKGLTMFRHTKYNLVYIGNGGFLSNNGSPGAYKNKQHYAFNVDQNTGIPIAKDFSSGDAAEAGPVHNSIIFANMLAWLIDQAEYNGINTQY